MTVQRECTCDVRLPGPPDRPHAPSCPLASRVSPGAFREVVQGSTRTCSGWQDSCHGDPEIGECLCAAERARLQGSKLLLPNTGGNVVLLTQLYWPSVHPALQEPRKASA
jgi:hypothetical protein